MTLSEDSLKVEQVRRNFSRHATEYEQYARVQRTVAQKLLQLLPAGSVAGSTLEIGCGTGMLSRLFLQHHPQADLLLSDIAHGMSRRVAATWPQRKVVDADAADLPFRDGGFDLVLSSSVYQWVDHLSQAFVELRRVVRPGGRIALALFGERTLYELRDAHAEALNGTPSHSQGFPDCDQVEAALGDCFEIDLLRSELEVEWHDDVPQLLRALKAIGAQNASRQRPPGLRSRRVMQRMFDCYSQRFARAGRVPATYEVIYLLARRR